MPLVVVPLSLVTPAQIELVQLTIAVAHILKEVPLIHEQLAHPESALAVAHALQKVARVLRVVVLVELVAFATNLAIFEFTLVIGAVPHCQLTHATLEAILPLALIPKG